MYGTAAAQNRTWKLFCRSMPKKSRRFWRMAVPWMETYRTISWIRKWRCRRSHWRAAGGAACIGTLEIPSLDLTLPVMSEWSYPLLKLAPCRYAGSAYQGNLVIAAHNYKTHFRKIRTLSEGSEVRFTDAAGNVFVYHVAVVEALDSAECGGHDKRRVAAQPFYL